MGFELFPIEDGDEDKYDIITITRSGKWNPQKILVEGSQNSMPYEPTDEEFQLSEKHLVAANHMFQEDLESSAGSMIKVVDPYVSMIETQVLAASAYRRSLLKELDPK